MVMMVLSRLCWVTDDFVGRFRIQGSGVTVVRSQRIAQFK